MKPCMSLCCMVHLWLQYLYYFHYICVDHGLGGKFMNIWMYGNDDHPMCNFCLVFYSSCESRLCYYSNEHENDYVRVMCRFCH